MCCLLVLPLAWEHEREGALDLEGCCGHVNWDSSDNLAADGPVLLVESQDPPNIVDSSEHGTNSSLSVENGVDKDKC